jgi:hypothetical protein
MALTDNKSANLATKYEPQLAQAYTKASVLQGKVNTQYNWNGVASINILTAITQPLNDYALKGTDDHGGNRYGEPKELDDSKQVLTITQDKSFAMTIDTLNYDDQMKAKKTGEVTKAEIGEQVVPFFDKYALGAWVKAAGQKSSITAAVTKDSVLEMCVDARKKFVNANIPMSSDNNFAYFTTTAYSFLLMNPQFISVEKLGNVILTNGEVGKCMGFRIVEVPDDYLGTTQALFVHKKAVLAPTKLNELKVHDNPQGISGRLIEGRYRGDAFVLDVYKKGVLASTIVGG